MSAKERVVLDASAIAGAIERIAADIASQTRGSPRLALVGVRRGGGPIAHRLAVALEALGREVLPVGAVDIALYRDDAATALPDPKIGPSDIPFEVSGAHVVLVDDVLHTGRTIRAAIDCLLDYGRPRRVWLAVLCDRGGRELPFAADFIGERIEVPEGFTLDIVLDGAEAAHASLLPVASRTQARGSSE